MSCQCGVSLFRACTSLPGQQSIAVRQPLGVTSGGGTLARNPWPRRYMISDLSILSYLDTVSADLGLQREVFTDNRQIEGLHGLQRQHFC